MVLIHKKQLPNGKTLFGLATLVENGSK